MSIQDAAIVAGCVTVVAEMTFNVVEASIADLQQALNNGSLTSVELVAKYLQRISIYDARGPCLNSIPILNPGVFDEVAASDARRAAGELRGPLDGIPYTLKDSMMYKGMTCSNGSPAFKDLVANSDSFVAEQLRQAGAVCIGRTNTPPMMASGMHRGVHGRAESPYNLKYLTAAFSSGSSNGAATSTAASFAAFGLGSETVSSGRSPASNNGLVAYTPSRTVISPRGVWPLYPTCDVIVPMTRTVEDMLAILDILTVVDATTTGDFWREQKHVEIPSVPRPHSYLSIKSIATASLRGKRIAVPSMYIGHHDPSAKPITTSPSIIALWNRARLDLEAAGATLIETNFPLNAASCYLWDDFLIANADPQCNTLASVDGAKMFPRPEGYIPDKYMEHKNLIDYPNLVEMVKHRDGRSLWDIDGLAEALPALEAQRKRDLEDWMDQDGIDLVVFPANGDVGKADVDTNDESARHALRNGVRYSHGNRAIRHMGVPTVSVTMGLMESTKMPVNLTFAGRNGSDVELLGYAYEYERRTKRRVAPPVTPALGDDSSVRSAVDGLHGVGELDLHVNAAERVGEDEVRVSGTVQSSGNVELEVFVDGKAVPASQIGIADGYWSFQAKFIPFEPPTPLYGGVGEVVGNVVVVVLARSAGRALGKLVMLDQKKTLQNA
ncbi:amidase like protein [Zymoseptoria brevis]|uniref:Amidase like protein n=1 Tax=Zymoseptoria brevis TaxID=1047168 RepID=A0A0F4GC15_9PEZI|nr:amidase like protein [Zymoseptoria brevis]